jgi:hypothetical protein
MDVAEASALRPLAVQHARDLLAEVADPIGRRRRRPGGILWRARLPLEKPRPRSPQSGQLWFQRRPSD